MILDKLSKAGSMVQQRFHAPSVLLGVSGIALFYSINAGRWFSASIFVLGIVIALYDTHTEVRE